MTAAALPAISTLPRGFEFSPVTFDVSPEQAAAYLAAIGDENEYGDRVPPLAAVAFGLAALQQQTSLPEGSLHTGQEVEHGTPATIGDTLTMSGRIAQRSERQGHVVSVIEFEVGTIGAPAVRARSTIIAPLAPA